MGLPLVLLAIGMSLAIATELAAPAMAATGAPFAETAVYLGLLLKDDATLLAKGLHREEMGELNLPSGRITALDPLVMFGDEKGFNQTVAPGRYKVAVFWTEDKYSGKRNAFATLTFSNADVRSWRMALTAKQDVSTLKADEFYGYGVDAGMGSFMSPEGFAALSDSMDKAQKEMPQFSDYYSDVLAKDLQRTDPSRLLYAPPTNPENNVAMFSSGFGDGSYASYFGVDADGKPAVLATTFFVLDEPPAAEQSNPQPVKK